MNDALVHEAPSAAKGLRIDLGRCWISPEQVAQLKPGSIVELDCTSDAQVQVSFSGGLVASGKLLAIDGRLAVSVLQVLSAGSGARAVAG